MSDGSAPVVDARYLMTRRSSLSGNVEDLFIPADMPGDDPAPINSEPEMPSNEWPGAAPPVTVGEGRLWQIALGCELADIWSSAHPVAACLPRSCFRVAT